MKAKRKYKCGHSPVATIINNNILTTSAWIEWKDSVGFNGTKDQCWGCYCLSEERNVGGSPLTSKKTNIDVKQQKSKDATQSGTVEPNSTCVLPSLQNDKKIKLNLINEVERANYFFKKFPATTYTLIDLAMEKAREGYISKKEHDKIIKSFGKCSVHKEPQNFCTECCEEQLKDYISKDEVREAIDWLFSKGCNKIDIMRKQMFEKRLKL